MTILVLITEILGIASIVIGAIVYLLKHVFRLGETMQRIYTIESTVTELNAKFTVLPCDSHHDDITKIKTIVVEKYPKASNVFSTKSSPRKLNDTGIKLYNAIHGDDFLASNKESLFRFIAKNKPLVALDVEQYANVACASLIKTPAFNSIKDFIYNEPTWKLPDGESYDITINDACFVLGLKLRDLYLQEVGINQQSDT